MPVCYAATVTWVLIWHAPPPASLDQECFTHMEDCRSIANAATKAFLWAGKPEYYAECKEQAAVSRLPHN
jgi:hypothetical protein